MDEARRYHYFGNAWRSLSTTRNLFGKLCLLALIQFVPILGQIVTFGYLLGWAREAAWNMDTPLPPHVFGRDDNGFWSRGVRAFFIVILYSLIEAILCAVLLAAGGAIVYGCGLDGAAAAAVLVTSEVLSALLMLLLMAFQCIGLVRMAIYERFGAAFQWGVAWRMTFHHFGGIFKLFWTLILAALIFAFVEFVVVAALAPGFVGVGIGLPLVGTVLDYGDFNESALALLVGVAGASLAVSAASTVALFALSILSNMINALLWRAFGNWVALYDVAHWGASHDPLPYQTAAGENPAVEVPVADGQQGDQPQADVASDTEEASGEAVAISRPTEAERRCSPFLNGLLAFVIALVCGLVSSGIVAAVAAGLYSDGVVQIDADEAFESFADQAQQFSDDVEDLFDDAFFDNLPEFVR